MTICENCKHASYCDMVKYGYSDKVKSCRSYRKSEPQTNFQRITQNEETLAEFICADMDCAYCVGYGGCDGNKDSLVEWLKQPHSNE